MVCPNDREIRVTRKVRAVYIYSFYLTPLTVAKASLLLWIPIAKGRVRFPEHPLRRAYPVGLLPLEVNETYSITRPSAECTFEMEGRGGMSIVTEISYNRSDDDGVHDF